jgi:ABC-type sugar transport system, periplasmic component
VRMRRFWAVCLFAMIWFVVSGVMASAQQTVLKFAAWDYELNQYDRELIEAFERANPDIKVEVYDFPANEYPDKILIMLAGGEDLDVFYAKDPTMYAGLVLRRQIMPIDDLVQRDGLDLSAYGGVLDNIIVDGKLYGLPYRSDFWILFYNKDMFDEAGIPYPTNDWTWNDFRETALKLTSGEGASKKYGAYIHTWASAYFIFGLQKHMGDLVTGDYEMLRDGLQLAYQMQMVDRSAADFATNQAMGAHYRGIFEQGNIGMLYMGTWYIQALLHDAAQGLHNVRWGIARLPQWEGLPHATIGNVTPVVINSKTEKLEAAWKLAKFLAGREGAEILARNQIMPGYVDEAVLERFKEAPGFPEDGAEALITETVYMEWPPHRLAGLLGTMVNEEIVLAMTGNKSIDQAIADMKARREEIFLLNP